MAKQPTLELEDVWTRIRTQLQARLGAEVFNSWFGRVQPEALSGGVLVMTVPTVFLRSWINAHYRDLLLELWQAESPGVLRVDVTLRSAQMRAAAPEEEPRRLAVAPEVKSAPPAPPAAGERRLEAKAERFRPEPGGRASEAATPSSASLAGALTGSPLDPRYTFASFMEGKANRMACAAARTVAEGLDGPVRFNPLFIHAGVGLGKTHLLQAIALGARETDPRVRLLYLTAEHFMWRFAAAFRDQTALSLKEALRGLDLLLIDDMQFLTGKAIQAEFCHLLNELLDSARQVVIAADRPPAELESLDERVRSRMRGGVTLGIDPPDYELRRSMLNARYAREKAETPSLAIPDEMLDLVARQVTTSGRDLEGAFNQLVIQHRFSDAPVRIEDLDRMLSHLTRASAEKRVKIEDIQKIVSRQFEVSRADMLSDRRTQKIVRPRQIAMYLSKTLTPRSLPEIGRRFGGRDHTTVLHAVRKIEDLMGRDATLARDVEVLKRMILD